jgi:hypothetical protein
MKKLKMKLKIYIFIIFTLHFIYLNAEKCVEILINSNTNFQIQESDELILCSISSNIDLNNICLEPNDIDKIYNELNCLENFVDCKKVTNFEMLSPCDNFKSKEEKGLSCLYLKIDNICLHFQNSFLLKTDHTLFNYTECVIKRNFFVKMFFSLKFDNNYCILQRNEILFTSIPYNELNENGKVNYGMFLKNNFLFLNF